jgi:hypothetical protein
MSDSDLFTEDEYAELLALAASRYAFVDGIDMGAADRPSVVWRHDVDYSPHRALRLAEIEHDQGVRCVYHLMTSSRYYNAFEPEITRIIKRIAGLGHHIGVHFDMDVFGENADVSPEIVNRRIELEVRIVETLCGKAPTSFSFHNVTVNAERLLHSDTLGGLINLSTRRFFESVRYVSDSNGMWRYDRLRDVLEADPVPRLMVLTHPEWWTPQALTPYQRLERCVAGRADNGLGAYIRLLVRDGRLTPVAERAGLPPELIERIVMTKESQPQ